MSGTYKVIITATIVNDNFNIVTSTEFTLNVLGYNTTSN